LTGTLFSLLFAFFLLAVVAAESSLALSLFYLYYKNYLRLIF